MTKHYLLFVFLLCFLAACSGGDAPLTATLPLVPTVPTTAQPTETPIPASVTPLQKTATSLPSASATPLPTPSATLVPDAWMQLPIVPVGVSVHVRDIYARGLALGNNPNVFSKIGDCDTSTTWFLNDFDLSPTYYSLGNFIDLQPVIVQFHGSFSRAPIAARKGFVAASVLSPIWSDPTKCQAKETPLACEIRLNRPSFAFLMLGTNDYNHRQEFEPNMRKILDFLIEHGVVPILATKADDMEGDQSLNATIARLAYEYDLPLWNFWRAVQPLPAHGLQADQSHLTYAQNFFDDPLRMQKAWPWRNLTALQTLDAVWHGVTVRP
jgi:hypothetical protein